MKIFLTCLLSATLIVQGQTNVPLQIEGATSPNGKYVLEMLGASEGHKSRIEIKTLPSRETAGKISESDFDEEGIRYSLNAVWNEDSTAFALNISEGRNSTFCRVFVEVGGTWKEAKLPEKAIEQVRAKATKKGGKEQEYVSAHEWTSPEKLVLHFQGNTGQLYQLNCRLTGRDKPRLEFIKTVAPETEPEPAEPK